MLVSLSVRNESLSKSLHAEIGKIFTLAERRTLNGIVSPDLFITQSSPEIHNFLILGDEVPTCTIELRTQGILIRFTALEEAYALVIPYRKLMIRKPAPHEYSLHKDHYMIRIAAQSNSTRQFIQKLIKLKAGSSPTFIDDFM